MKPDPKSEERTQSADLAGALPRGGEPETAETGPLAGDAPTADTVSPTDTAPTADAATAPAAPLPEDEQPDEEWEREDDGFDEAPGRLTPSGPLVPAWLAHTACLLLLALMLSALSARTIRTPDAYFHRHLGREMLASGAVPRDNHYLAYHRGQRFVDHEWAFQVAIAWLEQRYGIRGPLALRALLSALASLAVYLVCARAGRVGAEDKDLPSSALLGGLGAAAFLTLAEGRLLLAPEVFSLAALAFFVWLLETRRTRKRSLLLLPVVGVVWANVHGFALLGPILVLVYALEDLLLERRVRLLGVAALTACALFATPYRMEGVLYPFRTAADADMRALLAELIVEMRSPVSDALLRRTWGVRLLFGGLALGVGGALATAFRPLRPARVVVAGLAVALGLSHVRNGGVAAVLLAPGLACGVAFVARQIGPRLSAARARAAVFVAGLLLGAGFLGASWSTLAEVGDLRRIEGLGLGARVAQAIDHDRAIAFYLREGLPSVLWNDLSTGHALLARSRGRLRPVLCGQTDLSREVLPVYAALVRGEIEPAEALRRYEAEAFFLDHRRLEGSSLISALLERRSGFALVYLDGRDAIFLRRAGPYAQTAARLALDLDRIAADPEAALDFADEEAPPARPRWIEALRRWRVLPAAPDVPRDRVQAARFLLDAGFAPAARQLAREAVKRCPDWVPARYVLGLALRAAGDLEAAKHELRRVVEAVPDAAYAHQVLGLVHLGLGELGRAEEELRVAVDLEPANALYRQNLQALLLAAGRGQEAAAVAAVSALPDDTAARAVARYHRGVTAAEDGRDAEAERHYRAAVQLDPRLQNAWYNLGNLRFRQGRHAEALLDYQRALTLVPTDAEARYNVAVALSRLGRTSEARREARLVLKASPGHPLAKRLLSTLERVGPR